MSVLENFVKSDFRVLKDMSFDQLLQDQGAVVDEGSLSEIVDGVLGGLVASVTDESTQQLLEGVQEDGEGSGHAEVGQGTTASTGKVVRDVLLLERGSELGIKITVIFERATVKPASRAWGAQVGEGVGCALGVRDFG